MKMAAVLKTLREANSLDLFILYENDSLFIRYKDGTSVELSPCGTAFLHREAAPGKRTMKQLTRFAVSSFRTKIIEAVRIRNLFAARPYLCKELTSQHELKVGYHGITECHWCDQPAKDFVTLLSDGSAFMESLDGLASLTLLPHRQAFVVNFLCEVKYPLPKKTNDKGLEGQQQKHYYTWQEQIHSLSSCPEPWQYPLQCVVDVVNNVEESTVCPVGSNTVTKVPSSLPITCKAAHLHSWRAQMVPSECLDAENWEIFWQSNMRVIWKGGVTYRIFPQPTGLFTVEIDPGDGSIMRSQSPCARYFNHWIVQYHPHQGVEIQERVYSADRPLPDRLLRTKYSVGKLIKQATSYIEFLTTTGNQLAEQCCWKEQSNLPVVLPKPFYPANVMETAVVAGTGRFKAYSNGNINIVFSDRTILDLRNVTDNKENEHENSSLCQLILSNGDVQQFSLADEEQCALYQRYLQTAQHWKDWVNSSPSQRRTFYKDTLWDPEKRGAMSLEIDKIKRFNCILCYNFYLNYMALQRIELNNEQIREELEGMEASLNILGSPAERDAMIKKVLDQNNKAIDDIDGLLATINNTYCS
ncbi:unnamed protein product [Porites lobata]|uniref:Uncharacterized protein n=1 Tax=Porites lobata TaxID=104759 RepID=A0ABN8NDT6_9CNID|nr:unnamed protein product [Porites lobata]